MGFFLFVIFGIYSASWICRSVSFTKFGEFLTLFLQILFQLPCPIALSSTSGALMIKMFDLSIFPKKISEVIFIYFILVPLCSDGINSVVLFSSSLILFSLISSSFLSLSSFLNVCYFYLVLSFSFGSFFITPIFLFEISYFSIFICFKRICN